MAIDSNSELQNAEGEACDWVNIELGLVLHGNLVHRFEEVLALACRPGQQA